MRTIIALADIDRFPSTNELQDYMYNPGLNYSYVKTDLELKKCDYFSITWDRWLDCKEWLNVKESGKIYLYIDFEFYGDYNGLQISNINSEFLSIAFGHRYSNYNTIEIDPRAYSMDFRAYARAIYYLSNTSESLICEDNSSQYLSFSGYYDKYKDVIETEFCMNP